MFAADQTLMSNGGLNCSMSTVALPGDLRERLIYPAMLTVKMAGGVGLIWIKNT